VNFYFLILFSFAFSQMEEFWWFLGDNNNVDIGYFKIEISGKGSKNLYGDFGYDSFETRLDLMDDVFVEGFLEWIFLFDRVGEGDDFLFEVVLEFFALYDSGLFVF
jgi:hypothetical protein